MYRCCMQVWLWCWAWQIPGSSCPCDGKSEGLEIWNERLKVSNSTHSKLFRGQRGHLIIFSHRWVALQRFSLLDFSRFSSENRSLAWYHLSPINTAAANNWVCYLLGFDGHRYLFTTLPAPCFFPHVLDCECPGTGTNWCVCTFSATLA